MPPAVRAPDRLVPHPGSHLAFTPQGTLLAAGGWPCLLTAIDPATGQTLAQRKLQTLAGFLAVAPDGSAAYSGEKTATGFTLPQLSKGPPSLKGHRYQIGDAAFSPSGALILTGGAGHVSPRDDTLRGWDRAGKPLFRAMLPDHIQQITFLDEDRALVSCVGGHLGLWNLGANQFRWTLDAPNDDDDLNVGPFALSPDRTRLYTFLNRLDESWEAGFALLDPATGARQGRWVTAAPFKSGHCFGIDVHPGGDVLAALGDNSGDAETDHVLIRRLEAGSGAWIASYGHEKQALGALLSPDGRWLASALQSAEHIAIWDLAAG